MPLRAGEMMVIVRAQDFASRTLRRVSGELGGLTRAQMIAARQSDLMMRRMQAEARVATAQANMKPLRMIELRTQAMQRLEDATKSVEAAQRKIAQIRAAPPPRTTLGTFAPTGIRQARAELAAAEKAADMADHRFRRLDNVIQGLPARYQRLVGSTTAFRNAQRAANLELQTAYYGLNKAQRAQYAFDQALRKMPLQRIAEAGHALSGVGRVMQLVGLISTATFAVASSQFAKFDTAVTLAATQTRNVGQSFTVTAKHAQVLERAIMNMMTVFPASSDEMAKAAYDIYSSIDVSFGGGLKLLRLFNKVAVAAGTDLNTATQASITVLENYDRQLAEHGRVTKTTTSLINRMFAVVRYGRLNFQELSHDLAVVVPAAKGAQQSFDNISGAMAFLTRSLGRRTPAALQRLLEVFSNRDMQEGMRKVGLRITDVQNRILPFPKIIERVAAFAGKGKNQLNDLLRVITAYGRGQGRGREFTIQARRALIPLITGLNEYRTVQRNVVSDNNEFANSFAAMSQTLGVRWRVFMNQLKVLVLYIGQEAIPVFLKIGDSIKGWIDAWKNLDPHTRTMIVRIGAIVGVASLLSGIILSIVGSLVALGVALTGTIPNMTSFLTFSTKLLTSLRGLAGLGTIAIGIQLIRKGGDWQYLGGLLSGFGVGMLRGGMRGGAIGATIGIAATLIAKGGGWQSKLGQLLLGAGAGFAAGGVPGAIAGASLGVVTLIVQAEADFHSEQRVLDRFRQVQKIAEGTLQVNAHVGPEEASRQIEQMARAYDNRLGVKYWSKAGLEAATAFLEGWIKRTRNSWLGGAKVGGPRDAFDGLMRDADRAAGNIGNKLDKKLTLRQALVAAKSYTQVMDLINSQTDAAVDKTQQLATMIAMAFSRGNAARAAALINNYIKQANVKVTGQNVARLVTEAIQAGDVQRATGYLQDYSQAVQQSQQDLKQYSDSLTQWKKQLSDTMRDARQTAIDNLRQMWSDAEQANRQAFGQLFQGPWLTSQTFDLAKEWGITPRLQDMIKDLREQNNQFAKWRSDLDKLFRRGLPRELISELQQMGPEQSQPFIDQILKASPGQVGKLIAQYKRREAQIKTATKIDFSREINQFQRAGTNMGDAIIKGFQNSNVDQWFDRWIARTFPNLINQAVNSAVNNFKQQTPRPTRPNTVGAATGAGAPPRRHPARRPAATHTSTTDDHSTHTTIHIHMDSADRRSAISNTDEDRIRRAAFVARNSLRLRAQRRGGGLRGAP